MFVFIFDKNCKKIGQFFVENNLEILKRVCYNIVEKVLGEVSA